MAAFDWLISVCGIININSAHFPILYNKLWIWHRRLYSQICLLFTNLTMFIIIARGEKNLRGPLYILLLRQTSTIDSMQLAILSAHFYIKNKFTLNQS